jgi:DNA polymerase-3 subunit epsilon
MEPHRALAFVDLETTGLGPGSHRVAEVGVVTLDEDGALERWTTLVNPGPQAHARHDDEGGGRRAIEGVPDEEIAAAPRFAEIARDLERRLRGRLLVAHNARFDHAFLNAEFARAGVPFAAPALCTVMLSRKLYPQFGAHNLDAIMARYGLVAAVRHRALPDAELLYQFWQVIRADFPARRLWAAIGKLLAEPLLPPHLDLELIQALPEKPGVYLMRGQAGEVLRIGRAANLRREAKDYFRLGRLSAKAAAVSYKVRNIEWHVSDGELAARLLEIALTEKERAPQTTWAIRIDPAQTPLARIVPAAESVPQELFGLYTSGRKATNALARLAQREHLCHALLGLPRSGCCAEGACARPQQRMRALAALAALRLQPWPYAGPVGLREGRTVHVFDQWQWLGSARTAPEMTELAQLQPRGFNHAVFDMLTKALPRLSARRLKTLRRAGCRTENATRSV